MSSEPLFTPPKPLETAVLFLVFNRLDTTKQVFESIRNAQPPRIYIAADGARENKKGEAERVQAVREYILENIDWDCEIRTLFREKNLGCGPSLNQAISWFFSYEEYGIIIEDDCFPVQSFYWFCEELLLKYLNDDRLGIVVGTNHVFEEFNLNTDYSYTKFKACWGWASWRRAWDNMDFEMKWRTLPQAVDVMRNMGPGRKTAKYYEEALEYIDKKEVNTWDWHWFFSLSSQNQLCIFPKYNLVSNIGFGDDATHTFGVTPSRYLKVKDLKFPLKHPDLVLTNFRYDACYERNVVKVKGFRKYIPKFFKDIIKLIRNIVVSCFVGNGK
ncbi:MAG: glycosyltransferase [Candidatus Cloacimonetes bacterium]|jgi:hypothetical protein|nr:glycosyltransferase [Candidatus Cloacimonadota bacterium]